MTYEEMKQSVHDYMMHVGQPVGMGKPSEMRATLIKEEMQELLKEVADLAYVLLGADVECDTAETSADNTRELIEDLYMLTTNMDMDFYKAFALVHQNNMDRCTQDDGTVKRRADGKVVKNPNTPKVDLSGCV